MVIIIANINRPAMPHAPATARAPRVSTLVPQQLRVVPLKDNCNYKWPYLNASSWGKESFEKNIKYFKAFHDYFLISFRTALHHQKQYMHKVMLGFSLHRLKRAASVNMVL